MKIQFPKTRHLTVAFTLSFAALVLAQAPPAAPPPAREGGPGGPGGPGGFGGRGGPGGQQDRPLVKQFDKDGNNRLNAEERKAAREFLASQPQQGRGGPRGGGRGGNQGPPEPGPKVAPADVKNFPNAPLYDPKTLRTFFFEFENADWEKELIAFNNTDIQLPAKLTVDGKTYNDVGVHFRGASSFFSVPEGRKHSINLEMDWVHTNQNLSGYRTLNFLNSNGDPSLLRAVLFMQISREYIPAPKANFVHVVINGESWGIFPSLQQYNKEFIQDFYKTTKGARWKVPGSPNGRGTMAYLGEDPAAYKGIYAIKTKDDKKDWTDFIKLLKVLNETPPDQLEKALEPIFNVDGALRFLALDNTLVNNDGYWTRASDYCIYLDEKRKFHLIPHDANETFQRPGGGGRGGRGGRGPGGPGGPAAPEGARGPDGGRGPGQDGPPPDRAGGPADGRGPGGQGPREGGPGRGFGGGPGGPGGGTDLDPLGQVNNPDRPLYSKLLAVPALRARYLGYVRDIAEKWLDWNKLGPIAQEYHDLIADAAKKDTRKLDTTENFETSVGGNATGGGPGFTLKAFADSRRAYILKQTEPK